jgi:tetratricopeptide (TPR) repeat protein
MYAEAIAEFQKAVGLLEREPLALHGLGHAYAVSGKRSEARKVLEELHQLREQRYVSAYWIAVVYAGLGENDQAWEWFERAYEERASFLSHDFKTDPRLDGLRSDPRYQDLQKRMGLGS